MEEKSVKKNKKQELFTKFTPWITQCLHSSIDVYLNYYFFYSIELVYPQTILGRK